MQKRTVILALLLAVSMLFACGKSQQAVEVVENIPAPSPTQTVSPTPAPTQTPAPSSSEETEEPEIIELTETYTVKIRQNNFPIYTNPGYNYPKADTTADIGVYTIVAECRDANGNLWGRLKSGVGWVDVTLIEQGAAATPTPFVPKEGCCTRCGVELTDHNTAFEGFGLCEDCYEASLGPEDRCDNCGMDCSFSGKEAGLCPRCFEEKYPNGQYNCTKCGAPSYTQGWCDDCESKYCHMCGGPDGEGHNCDDYPNVFCPACDFSMHTTGVGIDGIVCPDCGTRII